MEKESGDYLITIYEREEIPEIVSQSFGDRLIGRSRRYYWQQGSPEEDANYVAQEQVVLNHLLVGKTMAAYLGERKPGIHEDLLAENNGWRVEVEMVEERRGGRRYNVPTFSTTNFAWRKVFIESGKRAEVFGQDRSNPLLMARILDEPYKDEQIDLRQRSLRLAIDLMKEGDVYKRDRASFSISRQESTKIPDYYNSNEVAMWIFLGAVFLDSYEPKNSVIPQEQVKDILESANSQGVDPATMIKGSDFANAGMDLKEIAGEGTTLSEVANISDTGFSSSDTGYSGGDSGGFSGGGDGGVGGW